MELVYDRLHGHLLRRPVLHADETTCQVLNEDGKTSESKSYIWLYTIGEFEEHRIVMYKHQPSRGGYHVASLHGLRLRQPTLSDRKRAERVVKSNFMKKRTAYFMTL